MQPTLKRRSDFVITTLMLFFYSALVSFTIYVDSSFLAKQLAAGPLPFGLSFTENPESGVGYIYALSALITLLGLSFAPRFLQILGLYRTMLLTLGVHFITLIGMAVFGSPIAVIASYLVAGAMASIVYFYFDILMESLSTENTTGLVRGVMMSISSLAWMLPPLISGPLIDQGAFETIYFSAAVLMIPAMGLLAVYLRGYPDQDYHTESLRVVIRELKDSSDLRHILAATYFLQFFYLWMVIYVPLYLRESIGLTGAQMGTIMAVALSAFVIFPYPAGQIADRKIGEKELLFAGFVLMAVATGVIPYVSSHSILVWAALLFAGRTGASIVETMADTYFFKKVDRKNASMVGTYRRMRPIAALTAPLLGAWLLGYAGVSLGNLFLMLSIILILPLLSIMRIHDTR